MKKALALTAFLIGTALAGPGNNSLIIGTSQEPPNIYDPWSTNNLVITSEINNFMGASLTYLDNSGKVLADMATQVPTLANGGYKEVKDGSGKVVRNSLTYTIRPDAKWSDGTPITVDDFEFWLKVQNDDRVPVPDRYPYDGAKITRGANNRSFTITFDPPYLFAQQAGAPGLAPAKNMQAAWNAFDTATKGMKPGEALNDQWTRFISSFTTSNNLPKVVAGAFKPTAWRPGNSLTLTRNTNYWRKPSGGESKYVQTVTYRFIPNTNTLKVNVLSGQIDALATVGLTFDQALDMQKRQGSKYTTFFVPGATWEHIDVNTRGQRSKDLGLDDARVRQALLLSINRPALVQALFQGRQPVSHTFVNPLSAVYNAGVTTYAFDPNRAKALFTAAGWKPGSDGILEKGGKKMVLNFGTTAGNAVRERVQQILQAQWKAVGVQVNIQNYPASVFFGPDFLSKGESGKWDLAMYAWTANPIVESGDLFKGSAIPTADNGYSGQNNSGWNNAQYNTLQKASETNFNAASRKGQFAQMQNIWAANLPALPLYFRSNPYIRTNGLVNYDFSAYTLYPSWDAYRIGWSSKGAVEAHKQGQ
ncbi:peptide ABC transporter substrate-binding protein [Deinococcus petrolearius]|uniref:Peptide ABC transporter substrate-binding protein n=1 Tax=Deinococcus petrolearius TaxID=1751295 RepID=A0ABW1DFG5_9DEIO